MSNKHKFTNELINETSPYLLQHAHNPVNWHAWNDKVLDLAKAEQKLLLISVGYSACHWCHVMEHESFEDKEVAEIMNSNYVCIKVDREERPDIDQVYMNAVQIMTGMGGWPMNVVALPDGRPVWGGTYFQKAQWMDALKQIANLYASKPEQLLDYAEKLESGLKQVNIIEPPKEDKNFHKDFFLPVLEKWKRSLDHKNGGYNRAPKFMMPTNYEFLLRYAFQNSDDKLKEFCLHTLDKISWGGVYDPIGGGFSRYSVDERWHVPHFEKMLYDNAQLVQLYSKAYKLTRNEWYKEVVSQTLSFVDRELSDKTGAFYSALDADSEDENGKKEEGAYYVWKQNQLQELLQNDFELFSECFNINSFGKWEHENYVLIRTKKLSEIASQNNLSEKELLDKIRNWKEVLLIARQKRKRPGLDDKSLTSWNAMMISGYTEAYKALGTEEYLETAKKNAKFILENQLREDGRLNHSYKNSKSSINGYLEDYAFVIEAFINLYEANFDSEFLKLAEKLVEIVDSDFTKENSPLFNFTSTRDRKLVTKTVEINDNVIPASNSVMAQNLFKLGKLTRKTGYLEKAETMLHSIQEKIPEYPQSFSNWLDLMMNFTFPYFEIAVAGTDYLLEASFFQKKYIPNTCIAAGEESEYPLLLKDRYKEGKNLIYVCEGGTCHLPTESNSAAIKQIRQF